MAVSRGGMSQPGGREKSTAARSGPGGGGGGNRDKKGRITGSTVGGMGTDSAGFGLNRPDLQIGNFGNPDVQDNARALRDKQLAQGVNVTNQTPEERAKFAADLHALQGAYNDSLDDGTGGIFSGLTPFREINPYADPSFKIGQVDPLTGKPQVDANWGFDTVGGILGLGSAAFPLLNLLKGGWNIASAINGAPLFGEANLGSSVFGGVGAPPDQVAKAPQVKANPADIGRAVTPNPVMASRSTTNNRISSYSGGGYNMGAFGKKPTKGKTNYLSQQLMVG